MMTLNSWSLSLHLQNAAITGMQHLVWCWSNLGLCEGWESTLLCHPTKLYPFMLFLKIYFARACLRVYVWDLKYGGQELVLLPLWGIVLGLTGKHLYGCSISDLPLDLRKGCTRLVSSALRGYHTSVLYVAVWRSEGNSRSQLSSTLRVQGMELKILSIFIHWGILPAPSYLVFNDE